MPCPPPTPDCLKAAKQHLLSIRHSGPLHTWNVTAESFHQWEKAHAALELAACANFSVDSVKHHKNGVTHVYYNCCRGGKAWFLERNSRMDQIEFKHPRAANRSHKVGCEAHIKVAVPIEHFKQHRAGGSKATYDDVSEVESDDGSTSSMAMESYITATIHLHHTGHTPGSPVDMLSLPVHPKVRWLHPAAGQHQGHARHCSHSSGTLP